MLVVAGIDVGKDSLEVCVDDGPAKRFDNSTAGIRVLVDWLKEHDVSEAAYEPTGGYERQLVRQLDEAGLIPRMVHPFRMRSLARARGFEAKTDGLDAQVLSLYGRTFPMADTQRGKPVSLTRSGPNCATCCGAGVSWSTSEYRNSTGWTKGSRKAAGPPPNGT